MKEINWSEAKILFKYPSRSRPNRFFEGLDSIKNNISQPDKCVVVCSFDEDDKTMDHEVIKDRLFNYPFEIIVYRGTSKSKIDAVNRDLKELHGSDIIVCMSDDMRFTESGFDNVIRKDFEKYFPEGDGCLHYPDQHQGERCMTMNITDVKYFNRFGYIYHPDYTSVECDLENQEVAKMLGRYKFVEHYGMIQHLHPSFNDVPYDEQYNRTENPSLHDADKAIRKRRLANNYDLIKTENGWETLRNPIVLSFKEAELNAMDQTNTLDSLIERAEKSKKLKGKLDKKLSECRELETEINALGVLKVTVNVAEEVVK